MTIIDIISKAGKLEIYTKGNAFMWTDEHISRQLLDIHLNPDIDLASRKLSTIRKTADWILSRQKTEGKLNILDLGCGPGLYSEIFAGKGHAVTGIDISKTSIEYARKSALEKKLNITYHNASYLEIDLGENKYDLIIMIYTDMGVLLPEERDILLEKIYRALKPGGIFIFDVLKDSDLEKRISPKSWEAVESGFWSADPYLALSESFLYEQQKVILFQHIIVDASDKIKTYRFWTHFFSHNDVRKLLETHKFSNLEFSEDVLPQGDMWSGENVIFCESGKG